MEKVFIFGLEEAKGDIVHKTQIFITLLLSIFFCSCLQAPKDYYYQFRLIEKYGMERREETQRKITDVVRHPEQTQPLTVAFFPEEKNQEPQPTRMVQITKSNPSKIEKSEKLAKSKVPVGIDRNVLAQTLNQAGFDVIAIRITNGRLEGKKNLVRVNFAPEALSYNSIYKQFLKLCAIVEASQVQKGTVDKVNSIVEKDNMPYMMLESSIENYKAYMNEEISLEKWVNNLRIKTF